MANSATHTASPAEIHYPESDGKPMGENDWHRNFIFFMVENLIAWFRPREEEVYVTGNLFWYPVEGEPKKNLAPDTMVIFGRPQRERRNYQQWKEGGIPPKVTFEVDSPSKRKAGAQKKRNFLETHGVDEHYEVDLLSNPQKIVGWVRVGGVWEKIPETNGWVSPALGIKFKIENGELEVYRPDGKKFRSLYELSTAHERAEEESKRAEEESKRAEEAAARVQELERKLRDAGIDPGA